jgi:hypothetical protein
MAREGTTREGKARESKRRAARNGKGGKAREWQ